MLNIETWLDAKTFRNRYQITSQTLYNWRNSGKVNFFRTPGGKILYEPLEAEVHEPSTRMHVVYGRVSSSGQKSDLENQLSILKSYVASNGNPVGAVFSDIASGMNGSRKGLMNLFSKIQEGVVDTVYVTFKDRLTRFGFDTLENIAKISGTKIVILNTTGEEDYQEELTQDLISIIHHFSAKIYSKRRKILNQMAKELTLTDKNE